MVVALTDSTSRYLTEPNGSYWHKDKLHLAVTKSVGKELTNFKAEFYQDNHYYSELNKGKGPPSGSTLRWINEFPECKSLHSPYTQLVELPITDMVVERIEASWGDTDRVTFEDEETQLAYKACLAKARVSDYCAEVYARYKGSEVVPTHTYSLSPKFPLLDYQQVALYNSGNSPGYALFMEQGTGKTPVVIARICNEAMNRKDKTKLYRAIIVCPKNVRRNWEDEFSKFTTCTGKVTILRGTEMERIRLLIEALKHESDCEFTVVICSYEAMVKSFVSLREKARDNGMDEDQIEYDSPQHVVELTGGWDIGVLDESHYIKSERTKRYKYSCKLREICKKRMILTGTPITNTPLDLYTQFEFLGKGYSGFYSWKSFRSFYGQFELDLGSGFSKLTGLKNIPFLQERLARLSFIVFKKEVMKDLPDKVYDVVECDMTEQQRQVYEQLRDQLALEIEAEFESELPKEMVVKNVLTKLLKLAQITSGFIQWPEVIDPDIPDDEMDQITGKPLNIIQEKHIDYFENDDKLEVITSMLEEKTENDKTIIWACWVPAIRALENRLREEQIDFVSFYGATSEEDRELAVERFNCDPKCKVFIGNPAAGGTGLNLLGYPPSGHKIYEQNGTTPDDYPTNCNHEIYHSQNWSPTARSQSEDRCHRRGTREPIRITDLTIVGTIDEEIREVVLKKRIQALDISNIKEILNNVLSGGYKRDS